MSSEASLLNQLVSFIINFGSARRTKNSWKRTDSLCRKTENVSYLTFNSLAVRVRCAHVTVWTCCFQCCPLFVDVTVTRGTKHSDSKTKHSRLMTDGDWSEVVSPVCWSGRKYLHETYCMQLVSFSSFRLCMTRLKIYEVKTKHAD